MGWIDNLKNASYTDPIGTSWPFDYEDVREEIDKRGTAFDFPDADGTYVQQTGKSGRRWPMRVFLWGEDYDIDAENFQTALNQPGIGKLNHPLYGTFDVVPLGKIVRRDDLKTAANQAVFDVVFWETIGVVYPTDQQDPGNDIVTAIEEFNEAAAAQFESSTSLDSAVEQATLKGSYSALIDLANVGLEKVAATQENVEAQFNAVRDSINASIDTLIGDPLSLAFQTAILIQAPARALTAIGARLDAYENLLNSLTTGENAIAVPGLDSNNSNVFHSKDLNALGYVSGSVLSAINNQFQTKPDALAAADIILDQMDRLTVWRDANFESLEEIDTGESYQQLLEAVGLAAGFLVQLSFSLKQERRFNLDRARNIVELTAELYGSIDDQLDFFIDSNNLTGSEILELPYGREIVYYV